MRRRRLTIVANTCEHYREHLEAIDAWLAKGEKRV